MSGVLKTISLDGFTKDVVEYLAGTGITFVPDQQDSNKITINGSDLTNYYNKSEVDALIGALESITMEVVQQLPAQGESNVIYLVPKQGGGYTEHVWIESDSDYEEIGDTDIDLSQYYTKSETNTLLQGKMDSFDGLTTFGGGGTNSAVIALKNGNSTIGTPIEAVGGTGITITNSSSTTPQSFGIEADTTVLATQTDLATKANSSDVYTKTEVYTKSETDTLLGGKLDSSDFTKANILSALGYEEVTLELTDTQGNTITKTILAEIEV